MRLFITFEGGEGGGKSTQARRLYTRLNQLAIPAVLTREPGGTPLGDRVRRWLKYTWDTPISPTVELLLFNAGRAQLMDTVIRPALAADKVVICDRFTDSTLAYQGYGRGLDLSLIEENNRVAVGDLEPDLTVLLDMPVDEGLARKSGAPDDRFESEDVHFHRKVRQGFLQMASESPERWLVVDARQPKKNIQEIVWHRVITLIKRQG